MLNGLINAGQLALPRRNTGRRASLVLAGNKAVSATSVIGVGSAISIGETITGAASQSANLSEWRLSTGVVQSFINAAGEYGNNKGGNTENVFIGPGAGKLSTNSNAGNVAVGSIALASLGSGANAHGFVAIGPNALNAMISGLGSVAIGFNALASATIGNENVAIGISTGSARATLESSVLIGAYASTSVNGISSVIAIGRYASATAANQCVIGSGSTPMTNVYFGSGVVNSTPDNYIINGSGGSGTNIAGANITIAGGKGTGSGVPGIIAFSTATAGSTGATLQTLTERMRITGTGLVGIGMTPVRTLDVTGTFGVTGIATFLDAITLKGYTVATLPAGVQGHKAFVTDALAPAYLVTVVGGGTVVTEVFYNGSTWIAT